MSQWKAQKRREGLDSGWPKLMSSTNTQESWKMLLCRRVTRTMTGPDKAGYGLKNPHIRMKMKVQNQNRYQRDLMYPTEPQHDKQYPSLSRKSKERHPLPLTSKTSDNRKSTDKRAQHEDTDTQPPLRDLARFAYSHTSLSLYRSDPLHRRKEAVNVSSMQHHFSEAGRHNAQERGGSLPRRRRSTGRNARGSQPNMKLRMEAMLERIKKYYA